MVVTSAGLPLVVVVVVIVALFLLVVFNIGLAVVVVLPFPSPPLTVGRDEVLVEFAFLVGDNVVVLNRFVGLIATAFVVLPFGGLVVVVVVVVVFITVPFVFIMK